MISHYQSNDIVHPAHPGGIGRIVWREGPRGWEWWSRFTAGWSHTAGIGPHEGDVILSYLDTFMEPET